MQSQEWGKASSTPPRGDEGLSSISVKGGFTSVGDSNLVDKSGLPPGNSSFLNGTLVNGTTGDPNGTGGLLIKPNGSYNITCRPGSACQRLLDGLDLKD